MTAPAPSAPPVRPPAFALVSGRVLRDEVDVCPRSELVFPLWQLAWDAVLYARAGKGRRARLLRSGGLALEPLAELGESVAARAVALRLAVRGDEAEAVGALADELSGVAEWARFPRSAAMFAEAVALLEPHDARKQLRVATLARDRADHRAAEWWGMRAGTMATRGEDWETAVSGWARVADSWRARVSHQRAIAFRNREVKAAERVTSGDRLARALHSLMVDHADSGDLLTAESMAPRVLRAYGDENPRLFHLAHDLSRLKLERGEPGSALVVLRGLLSVVEDPNEALRVCVTTALAARDLRDREWVDRALERAAAQLPRLRRLEGVAWELAVLAEVAMARNSRRARLWARQAILLARLSGEVEPQRIARQVLAIVG